MGLIRFGREELRGLSTAGSVIEFSRGRADGKVSQLRMVNIKDDISSRLLVSQSLGF